jgi:hypothetical protein
MTQQRHVHNYHRPQQQQRRRRSTITRLPSFHHRQRRPPPDNDHCHSTATAPLAHSTTTTTAHGEGENLPTPSPRSLIKIPMTSFGQPRRFAVPSSDCKRVRTWSTNPNANDNTPNLPHQHLTVTSAVHQHQRGCKPTPALALTAVEHPHW